MKTTCGRTRTNWDRLSAQGGSSGITLRFAEPQDWSVYNRLSLWVYVHPCSMRTFSFNLGLVCRGAVTDATTPRLEHCVVDLRPGVWNHVLWEIPNLKRDEITALKILQPLRGHGPEEEGIVTYDFDRIEIERVDAEVYDGWAVAPGRIAMAQGYLPGEKKVALAGQGSGETFEVVRADDPGAAEPAAAVLKRPVVTLNNRRGEFRVLDFSELQTPGRYVLRTAGVESHPFEIGPDVWRPATCKALNFFFCERCGFDVPGIHGVCHEDWQGVRGDLKKIINGGWHDAGDLSQGTWRTAMAVYAMLELVRQLDLRQQDQPMRERAIDEAAWGLDWLLKTRFGDGYRMSWGMMRIYTDNKVGTPDDVISPARNVPWENFLTAAVEAQAAEVLHQRRPELAARCLEAAKDDWNAALKSHAEWSRATYLEASWGALASLHMLRATGQRECADHAAQFGRLLVQCQEQRFLDGIPLTGFFYSNSGRTSVIHNYHTGFEESPLLALAALCNALPDHPQWIEWYGAALLHSEYFLKRGSRVSAPYDLLPNSVWQKGEIAAVADAARREVMQRQFLDGTRLNDDFRLRIFPIYTDNLFHGNTNIHLSDALALAAAARLRGDRAGEHLVAKQLQWVFGGNPFCQSLMYGEGYDYPPLFAYCLKDVVGALPVGMDCMHNDQPYWPADNNPTYREIWTAPTERFLWLMSYYAMPALVEGVADAGGTGSIQLADERGGAAQAIAVGADGRFHATIPSSLYTLKCGPVTKRIAAVLGGRLSLDLRAANIINLEARLVNVDKENKRIRVAVTAQGAGQHDIFCRGFNVKQAPAARQIDLAKSPSTQFTWDIEVDSAERPWVVVVADRSDPSTRQELFGTLGPEAEDVLE